MVGVVLAAVELRVHDDDQVAGEVDGPAEGARDDDDLDGARVEEALHDLLVGAGQALVDVAHALAQRLLQRLVGHLDERLVNELQLHRLLGARARHYESYFNLKYVLKNEQKIGHIF